MALIFTSDSLTSREEGVNRKNWEEKWTLGNVIFRWLVTLGNL